MAGDPFYQGAAWAALRNSAVKAARAAGLPCGFCGQALSGRLIVDHVVHRKAAPHRELDPSNLRVLHHTCHNRKTYWVDLSRKGETGVDGFPPGQGW